MIEINSLRILNDYLNQTIDALVRAQRVGYSPLSTLGLSHSPFAQSPFGVSPFGVSHFGASQFPFAVGGDPTQMGLGHTPYAAQVPFAGGLAGATIGQPTYPVAIDPFAAQRGISHTAAVGTPWQQQGYGPLGEIARQQQLQQLQLLAACRAWGVPV